MSFLASKEGYLFREFFQHLSLLFAQDNIPLNLYFFMYFCLFFTKNILENREMFIFFDKLSLLFSDSLSWDMEAARGVVLWLANLFFGDIDERLWFESCEGDLSRS